MPPRQHGPSPVAETAPDPRAAQLAAELRDGLAALGWSMGEAARRWRVSRRTVERLCGGGGDWPVAMLALAVAAVRADLQARLTIAGPDEVATVPEALWPHLLRLREAASKAGWTDAQLDRLLLLPTGERPVQVVRSRWPRE